MLTDRGETGSTHAAIVSELALLPHPEGGHYRETIRLPAGPDGRSRATAILFLLNAGEQSHWHRVDAAEVWLWHAGDPLILRIGEERVFLGGAVLAGQQVQAMVPAGTWQSATADSGWALVSCVVTPGFEFQGFELAAPGWSPDAT